MWQRICVVLVGWSLISSCTTSAAVAPNTPSNQNNADATTRVAQTMLPAPDEPASRATSVASPTRFRLPTSTPSNVDAVDATAIAATIVADIPPTSTPDASGLTSSLQGETAVLGLLDRYVAALTLGMMASMDDPHPLIVYEKKDGAYDEVARYEFAEEYISTLELIDIAVANKTFFVVSGGVGAHSSFAKVFSFDGTTLKVELEAHSDAGGGALEPFDVNQDGQLDLVTDNTDYYVFCYACGVRIQGERVYAWDGDAFVEQTFQDSTDATLQQAITYARAQRWFDVERQLKTVASPTTPQDQWNVVLMNRMVELRRPHREDPNPFLAEIFYGDYDAAVDLMRQYDADIVVDPDGAFFMASGAEGFVDAVVWNVVGFTSTALEQDATLTSAQFLRGWANTLLEPRNPAGISDLQAVANQDPFYAAVRDMIVAR